MSGLSSTHPASIFERYMTESAQTSKDPHPETANVGLIEADSGRLYRRFA